VTIKRSAVDPRLREETHRLLLAAKLDAIHSRPVEEAPRPEVDGERAAQLAADEAATTTRVFAKREVRRG